MSVNPSSRQSILDRVRLATQEGHQDTASAYADIKRNYIRAGMLNGRERISLMIERLREYDAVVVETTPKDLATTIAEQLATNGGSTFVAPDGLPSEWLTAGLDWKLDGNMPADEIERANGVLTASSFGIADSGTIVLHHTSTEGRRVLTLLPDWHLCVLRTSHVVETLPEYFDRCSSRPLLATYISGPSATADIEMTRIKGVHGPRFLHVIVVHDEPLT
jgi:L-lactate dehydrogenase complex protein LldG